MATKKCEKKERYLRFDRYKEQGLTIKEIIEKELKYESEKEKSENEKN